jgi:hypothetical protein
MAWALLQQPARLHSPPPQQPHLHTATTTTARTITTRRKEKENNNTRRKYKKLTGQPHARAGSMEVDGYENPC